MENGGKSKTKNRCINSEKYVISIILIVKLIDESTIIKAAASYCIETVNPDCYQIDNTY